MFFPDLLPSDSDRRSFEKVCGDFSTLVQDCTACLVKAYRAADEAASQICCRVNTVMGAGHQAKTSANSVAVQVPSDTTVISGNKVHERCSENKLSRNISQCGRSHIVR